MMKKNILMIIHKLSGGGAERVACDLANALLKEYNVIVVTFDLEKDSYSCNAKIINLDNKWKKLSIFENILKLKKIKKQFNINYSISFLTFANLINILSRENDKTILTIHNNLKLQKKGKIVELLHEFSCKKADKIVCVSEGIRQSQIEDYNVDKDKLITIYNQCPIEKVKKLSTEEIPKEYIKIFDTDNIVINVGRLEKQKQQDKLIMAFKKVVERIPDSKLIILGKGSQKEKLNTLIDKLGLTHHVYILDFDTNPYKYIKKSKLFILTSKYEGLPTVIIEAIALNIPIISADCEFGPREILKKKNDDVIEAISYEEYGVLIPNNKIKDYESYIARSMIEMLKNNKKIEEYAYKSKERIKIFEERNILEKWKKLLKSLG